MINDSAKVSSSPQQERSSNSPSDTSLSLIRQFARAYSSHKGMYVTGIILN